MINQKLQVYFQQLDDPTVNLLDDGVQVLTALSPGLGEIGRQATLELQLLRDAEIAETSPSMRATYNRSSEQLQGIVRLCTEMHDKSRELLHMFQRLEEARKSQREAATQLEEKQSNANATS